MRNNLGKRLLNIFLGAMIICSLSMQSVFAAYGTLPYATNGFEGTIFTLNSNVTGLDNFAIDGINNASSVLLPVSTAISSKIVAPPTTTEFNNQGSKILQISRSGAYDPTTASYLLSHKFLQTGPVPEPTASPAPTAGQTADGIQWRFVAKSTNADVTTGVELRPCHRDSVKYGNRVMFSGKTPINIIVKKNQWVEYVITFNLKNKSFNCKAYQANDSTKTPISGMYAKDSGTIDDDSYENWKFMMTTGLSITSAFPDGESVFISDWSEEKFSSVVPAISSASISGSPNINATLTASYAGYNNGNGGDVSDTSTYQWQICNTIDGTYTDVANATGKTFALNMGHVDKYIRVAVTPKDKYENVGLVNYSNAVGPVIDTTITDERNAAVAALKVASAAKNSSSAINTLINHHSALGVVNGISDFVSNSSIITDILFKLDTNSLTYTIIAQSVNSAITNYNNLKITSRGDVISKLRNFGMINFNSYDLLTLEQKYQVEKKLAGNVLVNSYNEMQGKLDAAVLAVKDYYPLVDSNNTNTITKSTIYKISGMSNSDNNSNETIAFADLQSVAWANESINTLSKLGVIAGYEDGTFKPNDVVTRAQFIKILMGALNLIDDTATTEFNDVKPSDWSYKAIASAAKLNITKGINTNQFGVDEPISRQDMAVFVDKAVKVLNISLPINGDYMAFADQQKIEPYAIDAVKTMKLAGIINGVSVDSFEPNGLATRAMATKIVYEVLKCRK